jgi:iron-sulfur cluster repair protein YtfE (RIC family)
MLQEDRPMASIDRSDPVILGHVLAEHRDLFQLLLSVRSALAATGSPTPDQRRDAIESMHTLRDHLRDHFAQEERGGFLEEAVARIPRLSAAVQSILGQHPVLLANLDRVIEDLEASPADSETWVRANHGFEAFSARMTAHERSENAVVQSGYNEDLGLTE